LLGFDFQVEYKPGTTNMVIDALSQCDSKGDPSLAALSTPEFRTFDDIRQELDSNVDLQQLHEVNNGSRGEQWKVVDGLVTVAGKKGKVYVPSSSLSLPAILSWAHDLGHEGVEKTLH
jgi:hypothetical protein